MWVVGCGDGGGRVIDREVGGRGGIQRVWRGEGNGREMEGREGRGRKEGGREGDVDSTEGAVRERLYDCLYGRTVGGWDCWCVGSGVGM